MSRWFGRVGLSFVLWLVPLPVMAATTIFSDNFESGNLNKWNTGDGECQTGIPTINIIQSTIVHAGTKALKHDLKNSYGDNYRKCVTPQINGLGTRHYISMWVNWGSPATTNSTYGCYGHWWRLRFDNGRQMDFNQDFRPCRDPQIVHLPEFTNLFILGSERIGWHIPNIFYNNTVINPLSPILDGLWHRVEMLVYLNTPGVSDGVVKVWEDGVAKIDTDAGLNPNPFCDGLLALCVSSGRVKRPRANENTTIHRLEIMTNADIIGYFDCTSRGGVQPCHDPALDYFLYVDDVLWADDCPDTGATCSVGVESTVKGKSIRIMEWFVIMMMIAGFISLMAQSGAPMKLKRVR